MGAKCIHGGTKEEDGNREEQVCNWQPLQPIPLTHPKAIMAHALQAIAASNTASQQIMAQILEQLDNTGARHGT
ncbi:hypothetical protein RHS03_08928, partial [Rhizoctonia solani]